MTLGTFAIYHHPSLSPPPSPKFFHLPKLKMKYPITPISLSPQDVATTILPSVSLNLTTLGIAYKWNLQYLSFCTRLIALNIMSSRFMHVVACVSTSFLPLFSYVSRLVRKNRKKPKKVTNNIVPWFYLAVAWKQMADLLSACASVVQLSTFSFTLMWSSEKPPGGGLIVSYGHLCSLSSVQLHTWFLFANFLPK